MKKQIILATALFALGLLTSEVAHHFLGNPLKIQKGDAAITMGKTSYPSDYGYANSVYLVMDKETRKDDASIVFREAGNARAEIGLVADNNIHIKTVTGTYDDEVFVDRFLIRATGEVDSVGKIFRQYATSGTPTIAIGNSDGQHAGSGLELTYNHERKVSGISSISRDIAYRPLSFSAESYAFHMGEVNVRLDPAVQILAEGPLAVYNGLVVAKNQTHDGGAFHPGSLYMDDAEGLVLSGLSGNDSDFAMKTPGGDNILRVPRGTSNVEFSGNAKTEGVMGVGTFRRGNLPAPVAGGIILVADGAGGQPVLAFSDGATWRRADTRDVVS